jgi:hypothetical protein
MTYGNAHRRWVDAINSRTSETGYSVHYQASTYVRGWPTKSTRPYHLYQGSKFVAAFAKLSTLEAKLGKLTGVL